MKNNNFYMVYGGFDGAEVEKNLFFVCLNVPYQED